MTAPQFSQSRRTAIENANKAMNGGRLKSDVTGRFLARS